MFLKNFLKVITEKPKTEEQEETPGPEKTEKQEEAKKQPSEQPRLSFIWIVLGILAVIIMWLLSSWLYS